MTHKMKTPNKYRRRLICIFALAVFSQISAADSSNTSPAVSGAAQNSGSLSALKAFSSPVTSWGTGIEAVLERAYRECFRTYFIKGRVVTLRIPFAQNNERSAVAGADLVVTGDGKANPEFIWSQIDEILTSEDFAEYAKVTADGREKVIMFDLPERKWSVSEDLFDIARMKADVYRTLPHKPYILSSGNGLMATDVYNYLYCVGRIGMDCSGFVWHVLSRTAEAGGVDLAHRFENLLRAPHGVEAAFYVGTSLFDSNNGEFLQIEDNIENLKPADIILFRDRDGTMAHSAVIQSVDLDAGVIRYLQCTDEAPYDERGVHESTIQFDPARTDVSLKDASLRWSQFRLPPFPGERPSAYSSDAERYRAFPEFGAGKVVRLRAIAEISNRVTLRDYQ